MTHGEGDAGDARGAGSPPFPTPRQVPREITYFTGRGAELAQLDELLGDTSSRSSSTVVISAIAGAAGIGKTSLAVRWACRAQDQFADGQLYVNLRGYDADPPLDPGHALDGFLRGLGLAPERIPEGTDAKASVYRSLLAGRHMLVLLDNAATADQVRPLLPNEPACRVLVTSRSRLSGLVARDGAHRISLDVLTPDESYRLLTDVIGPDRAEGKAVAELARRCDYLPLALRIAAERVVSHPHHTLADLVHELADEQRRLDVLAVDDDESSAVRAVFSWSYRNLTSNTAQVFRLLGLHPGPGISLVAVSALTGATAANTQRHLDTLVGVHLLAETGRGRYQFHDLIGAYAADRAAADEDLDLRDEATQRLYEWYLHTARAALNAYNPQHPEIPIDPRPSGCRSLTFTDADHARGWFIAEYANLLALIRHAPDVGQYTAGWQLPLVVNYYAAIEQPTADRITINRLGLAAAQHVGHQVGEMCASTYLGEAFYTAQRYNDAIAYQQQALSIAREIGDRFREGATLVDLATNYNELGRYADAAESSSHSLLINRAIDHQRNEGFSLIHLGYALRGMGQLEQAVVRIQQGLDVLTTVGAITLQAVALQFLAKTYHQQGRSDDAIDHLKQAITLHHAEHAPRYCAQALSQLGAILHEMGATDQAREAWHEALTILAELNPRQAAKIREQLDALDSTDQ